MDGLISRFPHGEKSDISEQDIPVLDLVLGTVWGDIHTVAPLYEVAFAENGTDNCKAAGWDDPLIGKLNFYLFHDDCLHGVFLWNIVSENITKWVILLIFLNVSTDRINKVIAA